MTIRQFTTNKIVDLQETKADAAEVVAALALKAPIASPVFTGTPAAPTAASGTNTTQIATTEFVQTEISTSTVALTVYANIFAFAAAHG